MQDVALLEELARHVRRRDLLEALVDKPPAPRPNALEAAEAAAASAGPGPGAS